MKKALALTTGTIVAFALPLVSFAAIGSLPQLGDFIIDTINNVIVPVLFALAFIVFLWGAFTTFILGATSDDAKDKGRNLMLWSLVGFFVMVSIWGLVNILTGTFDLSNSAPTQPITPPVR
jgi:Type IV secretion system pilin